MVANAPKEHGTQKKKEILFIFQTIVFLSRLFCFTFHFTYIKIYPVRRLVYKLKLLEMAEKEILLPKGYDGCLSFILTKGGRNSNNLGGPDLAST